MCLQVSFALKLHFIAALETRAETVQNLSALPSKRRILIDSIRILRFDGRENSEHNSFEGTALVSSDLHGVCVKIW